MDKKPVIAITSYYVSADEWDYKRPRTRREQDVMMSTMDYSRAVFAGGGIPVAAPVMGDDGYVEALLDRVDGLLLAGGPDISPELYGEQRSPACGVTVPARDEFELAMLERALSRGMAVFGICRGFQLINVYFGGTLYQDTDSQGCVFKKHWGFRNKNDIAHAVSLSGEMASEVFNAREINVNSFHHQAVKTLGDSLVVTALSEDGLIEGFEHAGGLPLFGVQWHPEMMYDKYPCQGNIFTHFARLASKNI